MSEDSDKNKGLRNIGIFLTADSLLAAVLLVWAQLWISPSIQLWARDFPRHLPNAINLSAGFGLAWTYFAVLLALIALAWAGWDSLTNHVEVTPIAALVGFTGALSMTIINVMQSFAMAFFKTMSFSQIYEPFGYSSRGGILFPIYFTFWGFCFLVIVAVMICTYVKLKNKAKSNKCQPLTSPSTTQANSPDAPPV
ncbi:MAG: hypothetical protein ABSD79_01665 [Dehalococcoidales bacterium]|jgi:hypothetical protein